jgi:glutaredoxin
MITGMITGMITRMIIGAWICKHVVGHGGFWKRGTPPMIVTLYTKAGCHLCDEARDALEDLAIAIEFDLHEIDIRTDPELFERYRYRIPVVTVDGREVAEGRVAIRDVASVLGR